MKFGEIIKQHRLSMGWTVRDVAEKLEICSPSYITRIENRGEIPSPEMVLRMSDRLGIDKEHLAGTARREFIEKYKEKLDKIYTGVLEKYERSRDAARESEEGKGAVQLDSVHSEGV